MIYDGCHLFIACFDQKIGVFQQTVVRVYYIIKNPKQPLLLTTHECLPICIISEKHNEQI